MDLDMYHLCFWKQVLRVLLLALCGEAHHAKQVLLSMPLC